MSDISVWKKIQLVSEWSPLLAYAQAFLAAGVEKRPLVVLDAAEFLASKTTGTKLDDELVLHLEAVLKTPEGIALVMWTISKFQKAA